MRSRYLWHQYILLWLKTAGYAEYLTCLRKMAKQMFALRGMQVNNLLTVSWQMRIKLGTCGQRWMLAGYMEGTHCRLGRRDAASHRCRPILLTLPDKTLRNGLLDLANQLKEKNEPYKKIYIKKDVHPSVRREWRRLREAERRKRTDQTMEDA